MTTEELLRPKYQISEDYPGNTFPVGRILHKHSKIPDWIQETLESDVYLSAGIKESVALKYPFIFVPIKWWRGLKIDHFPEYVKHGQNGIVRKIEKFHERSEVMVFVGGRTRRIKTEWLPSTKEEFELQENNKTNE